MEQLNYVAFYIPVLFLFVGMEWLWAKYKKQHVHAFNDSVMNICCGVADRLFDVFYVVISLFIFSTIYEHYRIYTFPSTTATWLLLFFVADFCYYWYHRCGHTINFFWAAHITHHQSEYYNLTVAFRLSGFQAINRTLFWCFLPLVGFPIPMIVSMLMIHGVYQFFLHTQFVGNLGILEYVLVTPSAHRVHHGSNAQYLDKNYGGTFIIWDRLFGTYMPEKEPVKYGLTETFESQNPYWAYVHYWQDLYQASTYLPNLSSKFKLLWDTPTRHAMIMMENAEKKVPSNSINKTLSLLVPSAYITVQIVCTLGILMGMGLFKTYLAQLPLTISFYLGAVVAFAALNCSLLARPKRWRWQLEYVRLLVSAAILIFCSSLVFSSDILLLIIPTISLLCVVCIAWAIYLQYPSLPTKQPA